jgi:hypothetical protein
VIILNISVSSSLFKHLICRVSFERGISCRAGRFLVRYVVTFFIIITSTTCFDLSRSSLD